MFNSGPIPISEQRKEGLYVQTVGLWRRSLVGMRWLLLQRKAVSELVIYRFGTLLDVQGSGEI